MMLAPSVAMLIRDKAADLGLEPGTVFSYSIKKSVNADKLNKIVILITEIDDSPDVQGSNVTITKMGRIQMQIFYPSQFANDTSLVRDQLLSLLERNDWYCYFDGGIERDPATEQLFSTSHFRKSYERSVE